MKIISVEAGELFVADVGAVRPGSGKGMAVVIKFNIPWVRKALAAVNITVGDLSDHGECKAALIKYYQGLNTDASVDETTGASSPSTGAASVLWAKAPYYSTRLSQTRPRVLTGRQTRPPTSG